MNAINNRAVGRVENTGGRLGIIFYQLGPPVLTVASLCKAIGICVEMILTN